MESLVRSMITVWEVAAGGQSDSIASAVEVHV